jgi:hypothetical protein
MIFDSNLPEPIPHSFHMPCSVLIRTESATSPFYLAEPRSILLERPVPCYHCGGHLLLIGAFALNKGHGLRLWQCPECLYCPDGNHYIEIIQIDRLRAQVPTHVKDWLDVKRLWSLPGLHHRYQNMWLNRWIEDGGFITAKEPKPGIVQIKGWSSSLYAALDPAVTEKPKSSRLLIQLDASSIDSSRLGLIKYYYSNILNKTILDYEYSEKTIIGTGS